MSTIYDWSLTPGDNATADSAINWAEGMFPSSVNNSAREMMTRVAEYIKDNGVLDALGTNTIAVTSNSPITAISTGMTLTFRAAATNTTAVTLNLNGLGGKDVRKIVAGSTDAVPLSAGDINIKGIYVVHYDATANAGAGAWILINAQSPAYLPLTGGSLSGNLTISNIFPTIVFQETDQSNKKWFLIGDASTFSIREDNEGNPRFFMSAGGALDITGPLTIGSPLSISSGGTGANSAAGARTALGAQAALGFTPVQQGGGGGQSTSKVYIGYRGSDGLLGLQVDATNFAGTWPINVSGTAAVASNSNLLNGLSAAQIVASAPRGGVGVGQTWIGSGLANNTWTTNSTGQPIFLAIVGGGICDIMIGVAGNTSAPVTVASSSSSGSGVGAVIPAGCIYKYNNVGGTGSVYELR